MKIVLVNCSMMSTDVVSHRLAAQELYQLAQCLQVTQLTRSYILRQGPCAWPFWIQC